MKEYLGGDEAFAQVQYRPANTGAMMAMKYKGRTLYVTRRSGETVTVGYDSKAVQIEAISFSVFGVDPSILKSFVSDAMERVRKVRSEEIDVYVASTGWLEGWEKVSDRSAMLHSIVFLYKYNVNFDWQVLSKKPRTIDTVVLDHCLCKDLIEDARKFLESAKWYSDLGIPYRRGYLLHGPPGCGKTSFCQVLAGALRLDVCMLSLSNKGMDDNGLAGLLRDAPRHSVVILEDVDAVFTNRELQKSAGGGTGITFLGLLNAINGVASQEGRLFMMTTNHIERLDPALIRPGRCDVKVLVCNASREQMAAMFLRFFPGREADARRFAGRLPPGELSMAQIQGHLVEHKDSPEAAVEATLSLLHSARPKIDPPVSVWQHLRRVGLEQYAGLFECQGYATKDDLQSLAMFRVASWSIEIRTDVVGPFQPRQR